MAHVRINVGNGTSTLIASPGAGMKIVVYSYVITSTISLSADFRDGDGTVRGGAFAMALGGPIVYAGGADAPAFECGEDESLDMNVSGGLGNVRGHMTYVISGV